MLTRLSTDLRNYLTVEIHMTTNIYNNILLVLKCKQTSGRCTDLTSIYNQCTQWNIQDKQ